MKKIFALVDCNNFYVSCERLFRPELASRPIIVLSNNDGCVISRSNEAKALGIKMATPFFKIKDIVKRHGVEVFSSNYALYGDLSRRVMETLGHFEPDIEVYSIDEAFLVLPLANDARMTEYAAFLRREVERAVGITVSIGLGATKTLAKAATGIAKKNPQYGGVFYMQSDMAADRLLAAVEVEDIWGIGRRYSLKLRGRGICNALALKNADDGWVRKHLTISGLRTVMELRGISCLPLERQPPAGKAIVSSRSFGAPIEELGILREAIASYMTIAAEKLRRQGGQAGVLQVFLATSRFKEAESRYAPSIMVRLAVPSAQTPTLLNAAGRLLAKIYRPGYRYNKAGVMLTELSYGSFKPVSLFGSGEAESSELMASVDLINKRYGRDTLRYAACGTRKLWRPKQNSKSPSYTTKWQELPVVRA